MYDDKYMKKNNRLKKMIGKNQSKNWSQEVFIA